MSGAAPGEVLSREELDALLDAAAAARREQSDRERVFRPQRQAAPTPLPVLRRAFESFAAEYGKGLSSLYQTRIGLRILGWDVLPAEEFAELLLPVDRVVSFTLEPAGEPGFVLVSRPLLFAWLTLALGGRPGAAKTPRLERPYTRIEERFLRRIVGDALAQMDRFAGERSGLRSQVVGVDDARAIPEAGAEELLVATLDVEGFGDLGRLRFALSTAAFPGVAAPARRPEPRRGTAARRALLDMPVTVRAEAGGADIALSRLARLRPGDVIPIEGREDGTLVLRIEGQPKFRALRGAVGRRLAVQIVDRLEQAGVETHGESGSE